MNGADHLTDLTFPISPDYVTGWTTERALAELIANALDADPDNFSVTSDAGTLTIEDHSPAGVGAGGMILGHSTKRDRTDVIGQFGEGLKIGLLVLLRDNRIRDIHVDTVGYQFQPHLTDHAGIAGLATDATDRIQVMAWRIHRSPRTTGTRITMRCPDKLAAKAIRRFLHLSVPDYRPPTDPTVMFDHPGGQVFIGGLLVTERSKLTYSYDLPLALAKKWQNRDRSVIDTWQLRSAVHDALVHLHDPADIRRLVDDTLAGHLSDTEVNWPANTRELPAATRALFHAEGRRRWPDGKVFVRPADHADRYDEAILDLVDRGYTELTIPGSNTWAVNHLARLLGVERPKVAARRAGQRQDTDWVSRSQLTDGERAVLDTTVRWVRAVYGNDAVGDVRVFSATRLSMQDIADLEWHGFYDPNNGRIAVHRCLLTSTQDLLPTLVHETGHRIAHRATHTLAGLPRWVEHADRTRGFERTLHTMAAHAVAALAAGATIESLEASRATDPNADRPAPEPGFRWAGTGHHVRQVPETAIDAGRLLSAAVDAWAAGTDIGRRSPLTEYARRHFVSTPLLRSLAAGLQGASTPFERVAEICAPVGVDAAAVWWGVCGGHAPAAYTSRRRRFAPRVALAARAAVAALHPDDADLVGPLTSLIDGTGDGTGDWIAPIRTLVERAARRAGLP